MRATVHPIALLSACIAFAATRVIAAEPAPEHHEHGGAGSVVGQLSLNDGQRWATEPSLRKGMAAIRTAFAADHGAIHAGTESDAAYDALAAKIEGEVEGIVRRCHLPESADANLHYVIADLLSGAGLMRGHDPAHGRHDGAARVHGALIAYGKFFDDPDWKD